MSDEHAVSALAEKHDDGMRFRGRCSCGKSSYMVYSTKAAAKAALRRTHLADLLQDSVE